MLGEEAIKIAKELDVTPVSARKLMVRKDNYPFDDHSHTYLDVTKGLDSRIIDAMGWLPGGKEFGAKITTPPEPVLSGGFIKT